MLRWGVNFERWQPTEEEWSAALALVSPAERERIGRFKRPTRHAGLLVGRHNPDAKSALVGRLLILVAAAHTHPHVPLDAFRFERTAQGKPYLCLGTPHNVEAGDCPQGCFNFNVSHAGEWVVLAAESTCLVGVDVMKVELRGSNPSLEKFFHDMRTCFTPVEWQHIRQSGDDEEQLDRFFRHWTLKEAYIKAVGIGLGLDLQRAQFRCRKDEGNSRKREQGQRCATATVEIDGAERREWTFELAYLDADHIVAVARGPFSQALDAYKQVIGVPAEDEETERQQHQSEEPERPYEEWRVWTSHELIDHITQRLQHE
jgi:4'-phosphopantetheinyl transferase